MLRFTIHQSDDGSWEGACVQLPYLEVIEDSPGEALEAIQDAAECEQALGNGQYLEALG